MFKKIFVVFFLLFFVIGCSTQRQQGRVSIIDSASRSHIKTTLTLADFKAFAENITMEMLDDPEIIAWGDRKPKLIVGDLENNTSNDNLRVEDIYKHIRRVIKRSGIARIVHKSATDFDYIIRTVITSNTQHDRATGIKQVSYSLSLEMTSVDGELIGDWADDLKLGRSARKFF